MPRLALAFLVLAILSAGAVATPPPVRFVSLGIDQGLSQSTVTSIAQDSQGFLWFGTADGLNRYDGYSFAVYRHDPRDEASLSNNDINVLRVDRAGVLWVGTNEGGLNRYDSQSGTFTRYLADARDPTTLGSNNVRCILEDSTGRFWVGTRGGGLNLLDRSTGRVVRYMHDPSDPLSLPNNDVYTAYEDRAGRIWLGCKGAGLVRFDPSGKEQKCFAADPGNSDALQDSDVRAILEDSTGTFWVGTYYGGLARFDPISGKFRTLRRDSLDPTTLGSNTVRLIYEDRDHRLWIGTGGGVCLLDRVTETFTTYANQPRDPFSLAGNTVFAIHEDRAGTIWIGTNGGGISKIDRNAKRFHILRNDPLRLQALRSDYIRAIVTEGDVVWIGTWGGGLWRHDRRDGTVRRYVNDPLDPTSLPSNNIFGLAFGRGRLWVGTSNGLVSLDVATGRFRVYRHDPSDPHSIPTNDIRCLKVDSRGEVWVGTFAEGAAVLDPATGKFRNYRHDPADPTSIGWTDIMAIMEDRAGRLWFCTHGGGLSRLDRATQRFTTWRRVPGDPNRLSVNALWSACEARDGSLWIGTLSGGVVRFDPNTGNCKTYREADGLPNDTVYAILEDDRGLLWMSTNAGLARLDPSTGEMRTYNVGDGLQGNEFNYGASHRSASGEMFFGGVDGVTTFMPDEIVDNTYVPPVVITSFRKLNKPVRLPVSISDTSEIEIQYSDSFISFEFAALNFTNSRKNQYAYMLEGYDRDWIQAGTQRTATYTNLDGGDYVFRVKGSNNDGIWNEAGVSIRLRVVPPIWKTPWAYAFYVVAVIGLAFAAMQWRLRDLRQQTRLLHQQVRQRTARLAEAERIAQLEKRRAVEANQAKSVFLSNISHELRTPLNAVLGFANLMSRDPDRSARDREYLDIITHSGEHLLGLINDVLSIARIEAGRVTLQEQDFDLHQMLHGLAGMMRVRTEAKGVRLEFNIDPGVPRYVRGDEGKLRQVLLNIIGNAAKFTERGEIEVSAAYAGARPARVGTKKLAADGDVPASVTGEMHGADVPVVTFQVRDTGPGIPQEELGDLFTAFVQASTARASSEGTGLGLAISRSYVDLMGGEMHVESNVGVGSTFTIMVPLMTAQGACFAPEELMAVGLESSSRAVRALVADDVAENRRLLVDVLRRAGIETLEAADGQAALEVWRQWRPHIVWMDVRMPGLDGCQATRLLRAEEDSRSTVVIAISAGAFEHEREPLLEAGCDDYVTKPFRPARVYELMERHLGVRFRYQKTSGTEAQAVAEGPISVDRLANIDAVVLQELLEALDAGDAAAALAVLEGCPEREAAEQLAQMIRGYRFDDVAEVLQKALGVAR